MIILFIKLNIFFVSPQDDAHIFCMPDQIKEEIRGALDFLSTVYSTFGFTYTLKLSTRPEKFLGEIETWDKAEKMMEESLNESGLAWKLNPAGKYNNS